MGLDFDALEYCKNVKVKQSLPPYSCPVSKCGRNYKTVIGLQYHLLNYNHDNPQAITSVITPNRKKARSRGNNHSHAFHKAIGGAIVGITNNRENETNFTSASGNNYIHNPESLVSYNEEQQTVTFNIEGKSIRLGIHEPLPFIGDEQYNDLVKRGCILNADAPPLEENAAWAKVEVPKARFQENSDYNVPDASPRSLAYYRFIEKSTEELDGEIEYDVDEEDSAWLEWINEEREKTGYNAVAMDTMELLMDRLEKESYFQAAANGTTVCQEVDDDAVCCICMDGECQNSNVILFCDMCNLAVHQDCYGVPYIPEGQWLCRRCLQSPSTPVNCVLCPNTGGAFKQTDRRQWVHVVCALWIPEVRFANTVFLEPIDSIETIPAARWRLTCYVCKEKGMGACIQCHRNSCYAAFHVTCAQQAGLYMTMDMNEGGDNSESSIHVQKYAFCHSHTPEHAKSKLNLKDFEGARHKMKEARKALAKKRSTAPVVLIPTIPPSRIQEIASMVHMQKKKDFLDRLIAYWTLKRKYRNGVPLLRRLQSQGSNHSVIQRNGIEGFPDATELYRQLKYWQSLRQDLERARLLCELVRKREKLKAAYVKICEQVVTLQLNPLESMLTKLLNALESRDTTEIFRDPVDTSEVPDYLDIVSHPMDLGTMRNKLQSGHYTKLEQMQADFDLMIQNCLAYNNKDTVFYRAGIRMRDQAAPLFQEIREALTREGLLDNNQSQQIDHVEKEVEEELRYLLTCLPCEAIVQKLLILADKSQVLKNPSYRAKKIKQIRLEISRMRKTIQKSRIAARHNLMVHKNCHNEYDNEMEENHNIGDFDVMATIKSKLFQKNLKTRIVRRTRRTVIENHIYSDDNVEEYAEKSTNRENNEREEADISIFQVSKNSVQTPPNSPNKCLNNSASPVGVNRRTAVLFTRKAQAALKKPMELPKMPIKEESNANTNLSIPNINVITSTNSTSAMAITNTPKPSSPLSLNNKFGGNSNRSMPPQTCLSHRIPTSASKSPKRNSRHKRLSELRNSDSLSPKKSPSRTSLISVSSVQSIVQTPASVTITSSLKNYEFMPDKFRVYRTNNERDVSDSDEDDMSNISGSPCSSCTGISVSCTGSEYESSDDDDDDEEDDDDDDNEEDDDNEYATKNNTNDISEIEHLSPNDMATFASANSSVDNGSNLDSNTQTPKIVRGTSSLSNKKMHSGTRGKEKKIDAIPFNVQKRSIHIKTATYHSNKLSARNTTAASINLTNSEVKNTNNTATPVITTITNNNSKLKHSTSQSHILSLMNANSSPMQLMKPPLEPLQLVWAKCRGYPWYPALILDPNTPKGFVYNGVPLPAPPSDVLALRKNYSHDVEVFLVLFFDVKRTWQWLPCNKLEILGINKELDQQKLVESRKPTERKAVKKAYQDALHYQSQVSDLEGQGPDPIM